ncbi:AcrR family transcriptional regulator [Novosphingobium sp. SG751A]|uniref:TetR/AcrR family transcriptional regulator n=1 Tax=Novosphingobium sp. SG751A TaxID=2587000 RepID=UPI001556F172|nr:TetR family transcriptional regulator [Novosphingobium sp. SG751A]NOW48894.1 AcrR family transcriptional regulator [Novosphingobium sp. SG751A]
MIGEEQSPTDTAKRRAKPSATKAEATRQAILDAAEWSFAAHGFDGVPLRDVAAMAGQKLGTISYHFKTKEELFHTVVSRRAAILHSHRAQQLAAHAAPTLEQLLDAFLNPIVERIEAGEPGWRSYARILADIAQDPRRSDLVEALFGDPSRRFIGLIEASVPGLSPDGAVRAYTQLLAAMFGFFSPAGLIDNLSGGRLVGSALRENYPFLISFLAGGIRALAAFEQDGRD